MNYLLLLFVKNLLIHQTSINTLLNLFCRPTFQMWIIYIHNKTLNFSKKFRSLQEDVKHADFAAYFFCCILKHNGLVNVFC